MSEPRFLNLADYAKFADGYQGFKVPERRQLPPRHLRLPLRGLVDLRSEGASPQLFIDVKLDPRFDALHSFHQRGAVAAETVLNLSASFGHVDLNNAKRMIDFGAGAGGPTLALASLARSNGGTVDAIESKPNLVQDMIENGIVDAQHAHQGNGIEFLNSEASHGQYDLVTAFMLGPDTSGGLTSSLIAASQNALRPDGRLVITSDYGTMSTAKSVCEQQGVAHEYVMGVPTEAGPIPDTLIVGFPAS